LESKAKGGLMFKKIAVLALIAFAVSTLSAYAQSQDSVFQQMADGIQDICKAQPSALKKDIPEIFQKTSDLIENSSPQARTQNLRGRPDELARRRGVR